MSALCLKSSGDGVGSPVIGVTSVGNHHAGDGNRTWILIRATNALPTEPSPAPILNTLNDKYMRSSDNYTTETKDLAKYRPKAWHRQQPFS